MKRVTTALGALLLSAGNASALPCAESYVEYREKMLLKGWEAVECPKTMHLLYPKNFKEVCTAEEHNWTTATAYWKTPEDWLYADAGARPRIFGYTLLMKPQLGLCIPPNIESSVETERQRRFPAIIDEPYKIGLAVTEWMKNAIHPSRIYF